VVAVLRRVTPAGAAARGIGARRLSGDRQSSFPLNWNRRRLGAAAGLGQMLLSHDIDFRVVNSEEAVRTCARRPL